MRGVRPDEDPGADRDALERLEADLALQAAGYAARERDIDVAARTRAERGALSMADRWRAAAEAAARAPAPRAPGRGDGSMAAEPGRAGEVAVEVAGLGRVVGQVVDVGTDHVALLTGQGRVWVLLDAVLAVTGLPAHAAAPPGAAAAGWSLRGVLRGLAEAAAPVVLHRRDGADLVGRVVHVGADHVDVAVGPEGLGRRAAPSRLVSLPLGMVACLEVRGPGSGVPV